MKMIEFCFYLLLCKYTNIKISNIMTIFVKNCKCFKIFVVLMLKSLKIVCVKKLSYQSHYLLNIKIDFLVINVALPICDLILKPQLCGGDSTSARVHRFPTCLCHHQTNALYTKSGDMNMNKRRFTASVSDSSLKYPIDLVVYLLNLVASMSSCVGTLKVVFLRLLIPGVS